MSKFSEINSCQQVKSEELTRVRVSSRVSVCAVLARAGVAYRHVRGAARHAIYTSRIGRCLLVAGRFPCVAARHRQRSPSETGATPRYSPRCKDPRYRITHNSERQRRIRSFARNRARMSFYARVTLRVIVIASLSLD